MKLESKETHHQEKSEESFFRKINLARQTLGASLGDFNVLTSNMNEFLLAENILGFNGSLTAKLKQKLRQYNLVAESF